MVKYAEVLGNQTHFDVGSHSAASGTDGSNRSSTHVSTLDQQGPVKQHM